MMTMIHGTVHDDQEDHVAGLEQSIKEWKELAIRQTHKVFELRDEIAQLKKENAKR